MAYRNPTQRYQRCITLLKEIACKVCELESPHMKMVLIVRYRKDEDGKRTDSITWDAWSQHPESAPQRELVWRGKRAHDATSKDMPFQLFSRRAMHGEEEGGTAHFLISDTKHNEQHELAIIFNHDLKINGVRKGDLLGNDFYQRVARQCQELGSILNFDREICRAITHAEANNGD